MASFFLAGLLTGLTIAAVAAGLAIAFLQYDSRRRFADVDQLARRHRSTI